MKVILDYLGGHIMHHPWSLSIHSSFHAPPKPPTCKDSFPLQPIQSLRRAVLKANESLEALTVLTGRPRETGIPELTILLRTSLSLVLTKLQ